MTYRHTDKKKKDRQTDRQKGRKTDRQPDPNVKLTGQMLP